MSDKLYAIKDSTLTALGDAVRSKVIGTTELPIVRGETGEITINGEVAIQLPDYVRKMRVKGHKTVVNEGWMEVYQGIGIAPGYYNDEYLARMDAGYFVIEGSDTYEFDFDVLVEGNALTFLCSYRNTNYGSMNITYEIIGLDENGNEFKYTSLEMVDVIDGLDIIPHFALNLTGNCERRFTQDGWNWFIENYGDKITTNNISNANYMFSNSDELATIPFEINLNAGATIEFMFNGCVKLKEIPIVNMPTLTSHMKFSSVFSECRSMREIPEWLIVLLEQDYNLTSTNSTFGPWSNLFQSCYSLRKIPDRVMKSMANPKASGNYYTLAYSNPFQNLYSLDEINNISCDTVAFTSNQFSRFLMASSRVKDITFETNEDGTPMIRKWKSQTLDFSTSIGWGVSDTDILNYNSGITADKRVKDDATYQALKNDPDWFTTKVEYSRYNHDSAVNTINSLPDCSATGTNTIKFKGAAGALTDGGAINTLTEEEIAVATAKGWTVSLV